MEINYQFERVLEFHEWERLRQNVREVIQANPGLIPLPHSLCSLVYRTGKPRWRIVHAAKPLIGHLEQEHLSCGSKQGFCFGVSEFSFRDSMDDEFFVVNSLDAQSCRLNVDRFAAFAMAALIVMAKHTPMTISLSGVPVSLRKEALGYARKALPFLSAPDWLSLSLGDPTNVQVVDKPAWLDFKA